MGLHKQITQSKGNEIIFNLFAHMVFAAQNRELDLGEVLADPPSPVPWSLATPDAQNKQSIIGKSISAECECWIIHSLSFHFHYRWGEICARYKKENQTFA